MDKTFGLFIAIIKLGTAKTSLYTYIYIYMLNVVLYKYCIKVYVSIFKLGHLMSNPIYMYIYIKCCAI